MAQCFQSVDLSWPGLFGLLLMILVLMMNAIAFGTNHWGIIEPQITNPSFSDGYMGVLQFCKDSRCERYLDDLFLNIPVNIGLTQMTRASATLTMVAMLLGFLALIMLTFSVGRKGNASVIWDVAVTNVVVGFLTLASFAVFAGMLNELNEADIVGDDYKFTTGYSFGLIVAAWVLSWIAAAIFFLESRSLVYMEVQNVREGGRGFL
eukprot:m.56400 g.56400  ORF g.56400 m.56400 type:complete len:207 (-) comp7672_c0_seq1:155-775(-)